ncbi:MAG TPA: DUF2155 domain-containing protein [Geobacteraceae bacterium]|nr:DUF2155 domain-containing protein [Geobacteraceae bacterium]
MLRQLVILITAGFVCSLGALSGCSKKEEPAKPSATPPPAQDTTIRKQAEVAVPASVKGKWKSVKLSIIDKETNREGYVTIDIGKTMKVNGTNLVITVENFLPHFIMEGTTLTSNSNLPKNPAVQVHITENGQEVFKGWLFTLYPNTHASQHSKYGFGLVDFTPAK